MGKALGDNLASIKLMGSSAIRGMPGTPVVDLCACLKEFPLTEAQLAALAENGFPKPMPNQSHGHGGTWFFGGGEGIPPGHLGRSCLHVMKDDNPWIKDATDYVAYCLENESAF